ncbi:MAG: hypothetical protein QG639_352 [Patescibacteria group bacterium]|jgi:hypothetical protein|nr:hypothetical protein [Patescibacteria group bacterium]
MADQIQIVNQPSVKDIDRDNEFLFKFTSVFPLDLFPDEVIVDKLKITIVKRDFFFSKRIITFPMTGTIQVQLFRGPITSKVHIDDTSTIHQDPIPIKNVWLNDALLFHDLVQGMVIGIKQGVNLMSMSRKEILDNAERWGAVNVRAA